MNSDGVPGGLYWASGAENAGFSAVAAKPSARGVVDLIVTAALFRRWGAVISRL